MQDLERELARYGKVLRDRAPAIGLDEVESRLDRPSSSHRPVRAAATGALVALASIGLVFVGGLLVDAVGSPSPTHRLSVSPTSGAAPGPAVMTVVVGSGALAVLVGAAAVGLRNRHKNQEPKRIAKSRERRKQKMQTIEKPVAPVERLERSNRYLIIGLVVAVLLAAGLGAWLIVDNTRTGIERDIIALIDDYGAAWEANDGDAVVAMLTPDATVTAGNGMTYAVDQLKSLVETMGSFSAEVIGDPLIIDFDVPVPYVTEGWLVAETGYLNGSYHSMDLYRVVEHDGELLIKYHETWMGAS